MKILFFITTFILLGWLTMYTPLMLHADSTTSNRSALAAALEKWDQQEEQLALLRQKLETIDVLSDPDHDERFWWNPIWRSNRENDLQEANRIILSIQELDINHQASAPKINKAADQYIQWQLQQSKPISKEDLVFWLKVDNWRFNYSINQINTKKASRRLLKLTNRELLKTRLHLFETIQLAWKQHLLYLSDSPSVISQTFPKDYQVWQLRFENKSDSLTLLINQIRQKLSTKRDKPDPIKD